MLTSIGALLEEGAPAEQFLDRLLALQADATRARAGLLLRADPARPSDVDVLASRGGELEGEQAESWRQTAASLAAGADASGAVASRPCAGGTAVAGSISASAGARLVVVLLLDSGADLEQCAAIIALSGPLTSLHDQRQSGDPTTAPARVAIDVAGASNEEHSFRGAAIAAVNAFESRLGCERVALGLFHGSRMRLEAVSQTEKVIRTTDSTRRFERAMEECAAQDSVITADSKGAPPGSSAIARDAAELADHSGAGWVCMVPIRAGARVCGAIALERRAAEPFGRSEIAAAELASELVGPRLLELKQRDAWFGHRWAQSTRRAAAILVGPTHTWAKLVAIFLLAFVVASLVIQGPLRVTADCTVTAKGVRVIAAPFAGVVEEVLARPGDEVIEGQTVLARLGTSELELELVEATSRRSEAERRQSIARAANEAANVRIAEAEAAEAQARIDLLESRIASASLLAPLSGVVLRGDLSSAVGASVERGQALFELAPAGALEAELRVPSSSVAEVGVSSVGSFASVTFPGRRIALKIERLDPIATEIDGRSVFIARAEFTEDADWLRPGLVGVARIDAGTGSYAWLWTRRLTRWMRLKLWL